MILVIDTSGPVCAAGIHDAGANALVAAKSEMLGKGHAERLIPMIDEVLREAGLALKDMTRIGVTTGPVQEQKRRLVRRARSEEACPNAASANEPLREAHAFEVAPNAAEGLGRVR